MRTKKGIINALNFKTNDTQQDDTIILQKAIDQGAKEHLPVFIPKGIYLVGALFLKDKSHLIFEEGAVLKGRTDIEAFPEIDTRVAGVEMKWPAAILNVLSAKDILIEGKGIIDGQGDHWWELYWEKIKKAGQELNTIKRDFVGLRIMLLNVHALVYCIMQNMLLFVI